LSIPYPALFRRTVRGTAASDGERRFIENTVRLSPGVREVRNELTTPTTSGGQ
jgi:hypothetical protein